MPFNSTRYFYYSIGLIVLGICTYQRIGASDRYTRIVGTLLALNFMAALYWFLRPIPLRISSADLLPLFFTPLPRSLPNVNGRNGFREILSDHNPRLYIDFDYSIPQDPTYWLAYQVLTLHGHDRVPARPIMEPHTVSVHIPTFDNAMVGLSPYFEGVYRRLRLTGDHKPSRAERSFYFCIETLPKTLSYLNTKIDYEISQENLYATAFLIQQTFLYQSGRSQPYAWPVLEVDQEDLVHMLREFYSDNELRFHLSAAGSLGVEDISTPIHH